MTPIESGKYLIDKAESNRRENSNSAMAAPLTGHEVRRIDDYAASSLLIDSAIHHLGEALPTGQAERAAAAYRALSIGVNELGNWMRAKGYNV